jgi:hypothetical protein
LRLHRSAVVGQIVLWRENYHRAILDFCNNICQERTHAAQQRLFDHLVGAREQHERNGDTNRLGSDQVYNEIETEALLTGRKLALRKETGP